MPTNTLEPSVVKVRRPLIPSIPRLMHPVPFGLTVASHDPAAVDGAVGGSGSSRTDTGSAFVPVGRSADATGGLAIDSAVAVTTIAAAIDMIRLVRRVPFD